MPIKSASWGNAKILKNLSFPQETSRHERVRIWELANFVTPKKGIPEFSESIKGFYQELTTLMPSLARSFPVKPLRSQEGDQLQRIASLTLWARAISRVFRLPKMRLPVTSWRVTCFRSRLSSQVKKARPFFLLIGGRGQGSPPRISGHTEISLTWGFSLRKRLT